MRKTSEINPRGERAESARSALYTSALFRLSVLRRRGRRRRRLSRERVGAVQDDHRGSDGGDADLREKRGRRPVLGQAAKLAA